MTDLTKQDIEVLDIMAKKRGWKNWSEMRRNANGLIGSITLEEIAISSRQAENKRWLKEIDFVRKDLNNRKVYCESNNLPAADCGECLAKELKKRLEEKEANKEVKE